MASRSSRLFLIILLLHVQCHVWLTVECFCYCIVTWCLQCHVWLTVECFVVVVILLLGVFSGGWGGDGSQVACCTDLLIGTAFV